mmetsp:Transcript_7213/g.21647  ORF Transcript_7213/g.21647 Transcript_7213/m.21647 type:complete len:234 (+) Transcript_7213:1527-2228(+)
MDSTFLSGWRSHSLSRRWPGPDTQWSSCDSKVPSLDPSAFSTISRLLSADASSLAPCSSSASLGMPSSGRTSNWHTGRTALSSRDLCRKLTIPPRALSAMAAPLSLSSRRVSGRAPPSKYPEASSSARLPAQNWSPGISSVSLAPGRALQSIALVSSVTEASSSLPPPLGTTTSTGLMAARKVVSLDLEALSASCPRIILPVVTSTADTPIWKSPPSATATMYEQPLVFLTIS